MSSNFIYQKRRWIGAGRHDCVTERGMVASKHPLIDEAQQKAVTRWRLDWPSTERGYEGMLKTRRGVDVMRF
jgi:hypothetical protein